MRSVTLKRPDGRTGSYGQWLAAEAHRWAAASDDERAASRRTARERHAQLNSARPRADDGSTVMLVYDEIGFWGITAADLVAELMGVSGDLELHLNTPGGDVFDGISIANALKQRSGQVRVVVDGLAASIGSVIAMAASPGQLVMMPNSTMMIHDAWGMCIGNADDMAEMQAVLDQQSDNIADIYAARTGKPALGWRAVMKAETWMVGREAIDAGLADSLGGAPAAMSAAAAQQVQALPQVVIVNSPGPAAAPHEPFTGSHSHSHGAGGDQGGDATHEHEHSHDGDADHGHAHPQARGDAARLAALEARLAALEGQALRDDDSQAPVVLAWSTAAFNKALTGKEDQ